MKQISVFYLLIFFSLFYSCDENKTNTDLNWQELLGNYTGEFTYEMEGETTDYWFTVDRKVAFEKTSSNTFIIVFRDTSFNAVDFHLTKSNPYLDTVLNKQIHLDSLEINFFEVEIIEGSKEGTTEGHLRIMNDDYQEYSGLIGIKYAGDEAINESIHVQLERFLPPGTDLPDSTESISFHAFR